jgi:hypothetical protein
MLSTIKRCILYIHDRPGQATNLKTEGVNNVNDLHGLVISTLIITTTLGRRVGTNVHINSSFNNPLQGFKIMSLII